MTHDIETRNAIIRAARLDAAESEVERLEAEVERLKAVLEISRTETDALDTVIVDLVADVERLKAHTWQQERAAIVAWLRDTIYDPARDRLAERVEAGEHWPGDRPW